eukprot:5728913-Amphidinium_carterae.1
MGFHLRPASVGWHAHPTKPLPPKHSHIDMRRSVGCHHPHPVTPAPIQPPPHQAYLLKLRSPEPLKPPNS